jgi:hypothetical protein
MGCYLLGYSDDVGRSVTDQLYSTAARCPRCENRAILTLAAANRLVVASGHRLESFRCPGERSWHVRDPSLEESSGPRRTGRP